MNLWERISRFVLSYVECMFPMFWKRVIQFINNWFLLLLVLVRNQPSQHIKITCFGEDHLFFDIVDF